MLTVPPAREVVLIVSSCTVGDGTTNVSEADAFAEGVFESEACTVNVDEPLVVGVPLSIPVELNVIPAGSCPAVSLQLYGSEPPDPDNEAAYAVFNVPLGSEEVVTLNDDVFGLPLLPLAELFRVAASAGEVSVEHPVAIMTAVNMNVRGSSSLRRIGSPW